VIYWGPWPRAHHASVSDSDAAPTIAVAQLERSWLSAAIDRLKPHHYMLAPIPVQARSRRGIRWCVVAKGLKPRSHAFFERALVASPRQDERPWLCRWLGAYDRRPEPNAPVGTGTRLAACAPCWRSNDGTSDISSARCQRRQARRRASDVTTPDPTLLLKPWIGLLRKKKKVLLALMHGVKGETNEDGSASILHC
jgi:hypothetical protein